MRNRLLNVLLWMGVISLFVMINIAVTSLHRNNLYKNIEEDHNKLMKKVEQCE